jgi:hypothetical protein
MTDASKKQEAQSHFKKAREGDAKKAMADYEAQAMAIREKTERLKALRLARDAAMGASAAQKPAAAAGKSVGKAAGAGSRSAGKKRSADKSSATRLADWLDQQDRSGRRS